MCFGPGLLAALLAGLPAGAAAQPAAPPVLLAQAEVTAPAPGIYRGVWPDGRVVFQTLRVISPDLISLTAHDHSAQPVAYRMLEPGLFRNAGGSVLAVTGPGVLRWAGAGSGRGVTYRHQP